MRRREAVMGMPVTIAVDGDLEPAVAAAFAELHRIDRRYSPFRADSDVARANRRELEPASAGDEFQEIERLCRLYSVATGGVFDAWQGGVYDPSGLVKGWAIDRAAGLLEAAGARRYFVDAGGDVLARGGRAPGLPWRVGIRHPVERDRVARVVEGFDLAVATSGTYEKGEHIWNRADGELVSLTVVGIDIVEVDVFATACFAMGLDGLRFLERRPGLEGFAIDRGLIGHRTSGFPAAGSPAAGLGARR